MLPVSFLSLPSSASMVMARRRDIQRVVENFDGAIRLGRAYDEARRTAVGCGRGSERIGACVSRRAVAANVITSCQMSRHTVVANTKEVEHA
jgi:hypothetical protein